VAAAFIPREGNTTNDFADHVQPETRAQLSDLAKYVLAI